jgi:hypothetical protein
MNGLQKFLSLAAFGILGCDEASLIENHGPSGENA